MDESKREAELERMLGVLLEACLTATPSVDDIAMRRCMLCGDAGASRAEIRHFHNCPVALAEHMLNRIGPENSDRHHEPPMKGAESNTAPEPHSLASSKLHPNIRKHLSRIGSKGGQATATKGANRKTLFDSSKGRLAVQARWARQRQAAEQARRQSPPHQTPPPLTT